MYHDQTDSQIQSEFLDTHKDVAVIGAYIQEFSDICENLGVRKFPLDTDGAKNSYIKQIHLHILQL